MEEEPRAAANLHGQALPHGDSSCDEYIFMQGLLHAPDFPCGGFFEAVHVEANIFSPSPGTNCSALDFATMRLCDRRLFANCGPSPCIQIIESHSPKSHELTFQPLI